MPRLFVYAHLLRTAPLHHLLDGARLLGHHRTTTSFTLLETTCGVGLSPEGTTPIDGEVYSLTYSHLNALDEALINTHPLHRAELVTPYGEAWYYALDPVPMDAVALPHGDWLAWRARQRR
ncbi:gamma-glutamylcyclotransferase family protein [Larsenimonas rhizosphaerae]|uniref:gamma-glutamylcyclotransferase family protein n=1 Tax=Larsenimonas rhizosphaerae TaxID=2944682 RepID=UPI002033FCC7|nr:gamma-glutamylcyclotransferase [Larsenimonas rhizosphaerae]MCM2131420.1 gamma-glutamylcyclotransferase [Larsenimonas rhizosphaerae]